MDKRVVLLEDNKLCLELMEEILLDEGYHVIPINHYEAVANIIEFGPQLILLDIRLSDGYGHLLCGALKANTATNHIPVILVSCADTLEKIANECHADNFLSKPFDLQSLLHLVKRYVLPDTHTIPHFE
jgi:DNA-binding response OmpR family regulator